MKLREYGKENSDFILFLHGGCLSCGITVRKPLLCKTIIMWLLPVLDGHADSNRLFTSIEANARGLPDYIDEAFSVTVLAICGLSLGGQILVEMLSQRPNACRYAIIESASVIPARLTHTLISASVGLNYGLIKTNWFSGLLFEALNIKADLYDYYYRDSCKISKENMIAFLQANSCYSLKESLNKANAKAMVLVGGKEPKRILDSARLIHEVIPVSSLEILDG